MPFSGGTDSTFTLLYLVKEYGLKPLVVQFDHGFLRPRTVENNIRTLKLLGVDFLSFRPNWHVVKKLMLEARRERAISSGLAIPGSLLSAASRSSQHPAADLGRAERGGTTSYYTATTKRKVDERRSIA